MPVSRKVKLVSFICFELLIYIMFLYIDIFQAWNFELSSNLKFVGIVGCFGFSFIIHVKKNQIYINFIRGAMFFTVLSDIFLLLTDESEMGVFTFCIVQAIYRYYLWVIDKRMLNKYSKLISLYLPNFIIGSIILLLLYLVSIPVDILLGITVFYFVSIVINVIVSIKTALKLRNTYGVIFALGMVLFLLCDINVGIFNVGDFILIDSPLFRDIYEFSTVGMWLFYLPAQVLLVMSLYFMKQDDI